MKSLNFTIDSHLLQELGGRLVGRPYIALAELVKNSYDADANHCEILFLGDEIQVCDDGNGMTFSEFRDFWMRIGTTNKQAQQVSRNYERPLTGSKGIGRLAVQFLGKEVQIVTTSSSATDGKRVYAVVDWDEATEAGELTEAVARYQTSHATETYANGSRTGTKIILKTLNHDWSYDEYDKQTPMRALAREVWMLQPPFVHAVDVQEESGEDFRVDLLSEDERMEEAFRSQLQQVLEVWDAKIQGDIRDGRRTKRCDICIAFRDGDSYQVAAPLEKGDIDRCDFEIRIFKLYGKQPGGIGVDDARTYFKEFGGVHVYDGGFRLPYYGIEQDWLGIQLDHSHRLSISSLLPSELNVPLAMHDLPTTERIFGVVNINTGRELRKADKRSRKKGAWLKINIGRDRLVDNAAYQELKRVVRWSIDYYASRYQLRQEREIRRLRPIEPPERKLDRLSETIQDIRPSVPKRLHSRLVEEIDDYYDALESENKYAERQTALLAPLAAAGLAALAFEHESNRQLRRLERLVRRLLSRRHFSAEEYADEMQDLHRRFQSWIKHHREIRSVFMSLATKEDREDARRLRLKPTVDVVLRNTRSLLRSLRSDTSDIPQDLLLPLGTMADWQALFQNVFVNSSNAMLDSDTKRLRVSAGVSGKRQHYLQISDTGVGVDLESSDALFDPFVRELDISEGRKSLGLGGMGMGLTIVRMICETRGCSYKFVEPEAGFCTSFEMTWRR